jgi:hypothetical protein
MTQTRWMTDNRAMGMAHLVPPRVKGAKRVPVCMMGVSSMHYQPYWTTSKPQHRCEYCLAIEGGRTPEDVAENGVPKRRPADWSEFD